jgi:hypothetical protein
MNITEAVQKIKQAGAGNTRITPMPDGSDAVRIEVNLGQGWATIISGIKRGMAEDILRQATNRVLLG